MDKLVQIIQIASKILIHRLFVFQTFARVLVHTFGKTTFVVTIAINIKQFHFDFCFFKFKLRNTYTKFLVLVMFNVIVRVC